MIAVVPARGGSKGMPGKNLRPLSGKPLLYHTLECAMAAEGITRVIVSTDDAAIADAASTIPGVEVPFMRPADLSSDKASAVDVYLHAAAELGRGGNPVDVLCALLPTAPLRRPEDIDACLTLFGENEADVVLSVVKTKPLAWHQQMDSDGRLGSADRVVSSVANRQDYGATVVPNGSVYVLDMAALAESRTYFGPRSFGFEMPLSRSIDIDGEDDLLIAEALLARAAQS